MAADDAQVAAIFTPAERQGAQWTAKHNGKRIGTLRTAARVAWELAAQASFLIVIPRVHA